MKNQFSSGSGVITLGLILLFCGISTFGFSAYVLTEHSTSDFTLLDVGKSDFQGKLLVITEQVWFIGLLIGLAAFSAFRWVYILRQAEIWNRMLDSYIEHRRSINTLSNYTESDLNKAYLEPDINTFFNMNLWTHKQMKYCSFIHSDVLQYHSRLNDASA